MNKITWVKGNTLALSVPLVTKTATNGQWVTADYVPPTGSEIKVRMVNSFKTREVEHTISSNVVSFIDNGKLDIGSWGIEITVKEPTERNLRMFKCGEVLIVNCTDELGEVPPDSNIVLDAAYFIQGPKGDAFRYEDFTPEQLAALTGPQGEQGPAGQDGRDGKDGEPIYPYFHVDEHMHLIGEPGTNRISLNEHKHLIFDYS